MIKYILALLVILSIQNCYSQSPDYRYTVPNDTLIAGTDSIVVDTLSNFGGIHNFVYLISRDTGTTYTDSIIVEGYDTYFGTWVSCGMTNMKTGVHCTATNTVPVSPDTQSITAYLIDVKYFNIIRQRLINTGAGFISGRRNLTNWYLVAVN